MTSHDDLAVEALKDSELLDQAVALAPDLFAVLAIAGGAERERFPLESADDLEGVLRTFVGTGEQFHSRGVTFSVQEALEQFPHEFFPVADRRDLLKKGYLAILGSHAATSQRRLEEF